MMPLQNSSRTSSDNHQNAVILVDYANVQRVASDLIGDSHQPDGIVLRLIDELKKYVSHQLGLRAVRTISFATIPPGQMRGHEVTGALLSSGIESRLTYTGAGAQASAIDLTLEASQIYHSSPDIDVFVILSGDRWYVPLAQFLQRRGRSVLVGTLEIPTAAEQVPTDVTECYFNARKLLQKAGRLESNGLPISMSDEEYGDEETIETRRPESTVAVEDTIARQALEIIETYFGQYKEVYLTPLLRKLTELLEHEDEPKTVINYLEECGAVWLEKRRGFPHNYTVLLVNSEHPDVAEIKEAFGGEDRGSYYDKEPFNDLPEEYATDETTYEEAQD